MQKLLLGIVLFLVFQTEGYSCPWYSSCPSQCTTTCVTVEKHICTCERRLHALEMKLSGQSQAVCGIRAEIAGIRRNLACLRNRTMDLSGEIRFLALRIMSLESLTVRVIALEATTAAHGGRITALEGNSAIQSRQIAELQSTAAFQAGKIAALELRLEQHIHPPTLPWDHLCEVFPGLEELFRKTESMYYYRYSSLVGMNDFRIPKPSVTREEEVELLRSVAAGKHLVVVDTNLSLLSHGVMLCGFALPDSFRFMPDRQGGHGTKLLAVSDAETLPLRVAVLELLLKHRTITGKIETSEGFVVKESYAGTYLVYPR